MHIYAAVLSYIFTIIVLRIRALGSQAEGNSPLTLI